ncbi:MAG TPA: hypothetical protein EYP22_01275, partial [Methanosarcinales archaeon]|nr:hypothetical protein [Methanosarcinales archaeon]
MSKFKKIISIGIVFCFTSYNVTYGMPAGKSIASEEKPFKKLSIEDIGIPKDIGTIKDRYKGKDPRFIIHIQDAHCNYEAQKNISRIVETLYKDYNINLISVEGADGYVDTSWFKAFPDVEIRREVADYFMKKGEITGVEFLSITEDYPIKIYGAENK